MTEINLDDIIDSVVPQNSFTPTAEQEAIMEAAKTASASLMIDAKAGCAKTTTLELMARAMPVKASLALAFNVKIKKELEKRFPSHFQVKTLNGIGHVAWGGAIGKRCGVDTDKLKNILKQLAKDNDAQLGELFVSILQLTNKARQAGLIPKKFPFPGLVEDSWTSWEDLADELYIDLHEELHFFAHELLTHCIHQSYQGVIDFDDQIYMSALFGGVYSRYPVVMVDEAQDLSPLNHLQLRKVSSDRLIVVGDPRQAIYAFRGADSNSMANLRKLRETWIDLPLSTTFRCPHSIVARQQQHAPGFNAAASAPEGQVLSWRGTEEKWSIKEVEALAKGRQIAILCRNNAPIIAAALRIIRTGRGCTVMGGEIGKSLVNLSRKILPHEDESYETCVDKISIWKRNEIMKARANEKEERVAIINDRAECLIAVLDNCKTPTSTGMRQALQTMFSKQSLSITLATGHKAKGLEWPVVLHLDPWRVPSKWAKKALDLGNKAPMEQELNLKYVIETRTKDILIQANLEDMA